MPYNLKRKAGIQKKSERDLLEIVKSGSLSAAAAEWELNHRGFNKDAKSVNTKRDRENVEGTTS